MKQIILYISTLILVVNSILTSYGGTFTPARSYKTYVEDALGYPYPTFNNFKYPSPYTVDPAGSARNHDERTFTLVRNCGQDGLCNGHALSDSISTVNEGDTLEFEIFFHNNGEDPHDGGEESSPDATNVNIGIDADEIEDRVLGFTYADNNKYKNSSGTTINYSSGDYRFYSAANGTQAKTASDDTILNLPSNLELEFLSTRNPALYMAYGYKSDSQEISDPDANPDDNLNTFYFSQLPTSNTSFPVKVEDGPPINITAKSVKDHSTGKEYVHFNYLPGCFRYSGYIWIRAKVVEKPEEPCDHLASSSSLGDPIEKGETTIFRATPYSATTEDIDNWFKHKLKYTTLENNGWFGYSASDTTHAYLDDVSPGSIWYVYGEGMIVHPVPVYFLADKIGSKKVVIDTKGTDVPACTDKYSIEETVPAPLCKTLNVAKTPNVDLTTLTTNIKLTISGTDTNTPPAPLPGTTKIRFSGTGGSEIWLYSQFGGKLLKIPYNTPVNLDPSPFSYRFEGAPPAGTINVSIAPGDPMYDPETCVWSEVIEEEETPVCASLPVTTSPDPVEIPEGSSSINATITCQQALDTIGHNIPPTAPILLAAGTTNATFDPTSPTTLGECMDGISATGISDTGTIEVSIGGEYASDVCKNPITVTKESSGDDDDDDDDDNTGDDDNDSEITKYVYDKNEGFYGNWSSLINIGPTENVTYMADVEIDDSSSINVKENKFGGGKIPSENTNSDFNGYLLYSSMAIGVKDGSNSYLIYQSDHFNPSLYKNIDVGDKKINGEYQNYGKSFEYFEENYKCDSDGDPVTGDVCINIENFSTIENTFKNGNQLKFKIDGSIDNIYIVYQVTNYTAIGDELCAKLTSEDGCGEKFINEINLVGKNTDTATVVVLCPFILSRNSGDILFHDEIEAGMDVDKCGVQNVPLIIKPKKDQTPGTPSTGPNDPEDPIVAINPDHDICKLSNNEGGGNPEEYDNVFKHFSSYVCEMQSALNEDWRQKVITDTLQANITKISRWSAKVGNVVLTNMERVKTEFPNNLQSGVFMTKEGNMTITGETSSSGGPSTSSISTFKIYGDDQESLVSWTKLLFASVLSAFSGSSLDANTGLPAAQTYIVQNGDLYINSNIEYDDTKNANPSNPKTLPSAAFIVLDGNIYIDKNVSKIDGILLALDTDGDTQGKIYSYDKTSPSSTANIGVISNIPLVIRGSLIGDINNLFQNRRAVGDPLRDEGSITIRYDERLLLNTPPGLNEIMNVTQLKSAR